VSAVYLDYAGAAVEEGGGSTEFVQCLVVSGEHFDNFELLNCKGLKESEHECLLKGVACKVRVKDLCGCREYASAVSSSGIGHRTYRETLLPAL